MSVFVKNLKVKVLVETKMSQMLFSYFSMIIRSRNGGCLLSVGDSRAELLGKYLLTNRGWGQGPILTVERCKVNHILNIMLACVNAYSDRLTRLFLPLDLVHCRG